MFVDKLGAGSAPSATGAATIAFVGICATMEPICTVAARRLGRGRAFGSASPPSRPLLLHERENDRSSAIFTNVTESLLPYVVKPDVHVGRLFRDASDMIE
jgi:hypothetical protein